MNAKAKLKMFRPARLLLIAFLAVSLVSFTSNAALSGPGTSSCIINGQSLTLTSEQALQNEICTNWSYFLPIAIIAVLLSFLIAAFIFIIGTVTKQESIRRFGIGELYEAIATTIIIGAFLSITGVLLQTAPSSLIYSLGSTGGVAPTTTITDPYVLATQDISNTINVMRYEYDCVLNGNTHGTLPPPNAANAPVYGAGGQQVKACQIGSGTNGPTYNFAYLSDLLSQSCSFNIQIGGEDSPILSNICQTTTASLQLGYYVTQQLPEISLGAFLIDGMYVLWGLYYLLIFFSFVSPIFIIIGIIFRAIIPTRAFGGILIATGIGFYLVAPVLFSFLYSPDIAPFSSATINANPCIGVSAPNSCILFQSIFGVLNGLWLQLVFFPIIIIAITYSFVTQLAAFLGSAPQSTSRLRAGFI